MSTPPLVDQKTGVMKSLLPTITMQKEDDTIDLLVNFEVTSVPRLTSAHYPFDGSTEYGTTFDLGQGTSAEMSITVTKLASEGAVNVKTNMFNFIPIATHCRIWSRVGNSPSAIKLQMTRGVNAVPEDMNVRDATPGLLWNCLLYTSPSPRDLSTSRMPSSA